MTALPQHMAALAHANEIRLANSHLARKVRAMPPREAAELVADIIENDYEHEATGGMPVNRLLVAVRRLGESKVEKLLVVAGVGNHSKKLRDLTARQRVAVAAQLRLWSVGYGR